MDYYAILGVPRTASPDAIKEAYLRLARENHPDRFRDPAERERAESRFQQINESYNHLRDARLRQEYDRSLARQAMTPQQEAQLYYKTGQMKEQIKDYNEALQAYHEAMRVDPANTLYLVAAARVLARDASRARQAAEMYEKAIAQDPNSLEPYLELGDLLTRSRLYTRARRVYEVALQHHPGDLQIKMRVSSLDAIKK
jgi:curved DNA-binding protein CbpA